MNYAQFLYILGYDGMKRNKSNGEAGTTMPEVLVAAILLAVFFGSIFELNAVCLRYIDASKESIAALQLVNDRSENLRNLAFTDLTNSSFVQNLLRSPANPSEFAKKATEVIKISAYPAANGVTQLTRSANGGVSIDSVAANLGSTLVQVDVAVSWMMSLGTRARSEQLTSIISNGTKK
jgi:Tfp pilus assembly protein PilV